MLPTRSRHPAGQLPFSLPTSKLFPSISKNPLVFSKDFQRMSWWFCGISKACNSSKPQKPTFQTFRLSGRANALTNSKCEAWLMDTHDRTITLFSIFRDKKVYLGAWRSWQGIDISTLFDLAMVVLRFSPQPSLRLPGRFRAVDMSPEIDVRAVASPA